MSRYFRKPENYPELAELVSKYCFRTLRSQAIENYRLLSLSSYGLLNSRSPNKYGSERKTFYRLSELGFVLIKYGLDVENCEKYVWRNEEDETKIQKPTISD